MEEQVERVTRALHDTDYGEYDDDEDIADDNNQTTPTEGMTVQRHVVEVN